MLEPGVRAPDFVLPDTRGVASQFYGRAGGRPVLLIFGSGEMFCDGCDRFVVARSAEELEGADEGFADADGTVFERYGVEREGAFLLDPNLRIVCRVDPGDSGPAEVLRSGMAEMETSEPIEVGHVAPVLIVPRVLEVAHCEFLMTLWEREGHVETGVEVSDDQGQAAILDDLHKRREDHTVTDPKLIRLLTTTLGRRLLPELDRAFGVGPTRFEGFKIACYDAASSGFFDAHRDNLSPSTAHRQFAVSLNLNEDYEGGHLLFPEYGSHRYRPGMGGALIFSCVHLHAVAPVTRGRRFALLTFLYDRDRSTDSASSSKSSGSSPPGTIDPFRSSVSRG